MKYSIFLLFLPFLAIAPSLSPVWAGPSNPEPCVVKGVPSPIPDVKLEVVVIKGLIDPVHITNAVDGSGRLFITEQAGVIRILKGGRLFPPPFLNIRERVESGGEMGLLSVAFHPKFRENRRFFVNYTSPSGGLHTVVSEFRVGPDPDVADSKSEKMILTVDQPFSNHNGGQITFGPDGYLYIGMGDGGGANDPYGHGQNLSILLGAILRIDVDKREGKREYRVPDDNPFNTYPNAKPEIWAYGLRNPWRFSFDPLTGLLYAGDVGQYDREEIDIIEPGKNYGWNIMEGTICTPGVNPKCNKTALTPPLIDYGRNEGITVIGGFVYRGQDIPALCGAYIYADWGSGKIWALRHQGHKVIEQRMLLDTRLSISSFGIDERYEVYVVDHKGGVYKIKRF